MELGKSRFVYHMPPKPSANEQGAKPEDSETSQPPAAEEAPRLSPPAVSRLAPLSPAPGPKPQVAVKPLKRAVGSRNVAILVSAAAGLLILGTYLAHRTAKADKPAPPPEIVDHLDVTELGVLPEPLHAGAQAILDGAFQLPAWLLAMEPDAAGQLDYPVREAVEELQPTLKWSIAANSCNVAVFDPDTHKVIARAEIFKESQWTIPLELEHGKIYTWEVATTGQITRKQFRVIDETEAAWLVELRKTHGDSHLIMGVAYLELGLLAPAQRELHALAQAHPHSPEAAQLARMADGFLAH